METFVSIFTLVFIVLIILAVSAFAAMVIVDNLDKLTLENNGYVVTREGKKPVFFKYIQDARRHAAWLDGKKTKYCIYQIIEMHLYEINKELL